MLHQDAHQPCSCIAQWNHVACESVLASLVTQALEQLMIQEASACLEATITPSQWDASYHGPDLCPTPTVLDSLYIRQAPVRLLRDRDIYLKTLVQLDLAAEHTIQLSTCYLSSNNAPCFTAQQPPEPALAFFATADADGFPESQ
jgi:hypothetical protein